MSEAPTPGPSKRTKYRLKIGKHPVTPRVDVPTGPERPLFRIEWEDPEFGLTVVVRELEDGKMMIDAFCSDAAMLDNLALAVGLVGKPDTMPITKHVYFDTPDPAGCRGSRSFDTFAQAVEYLGPRIGLAVHRLII